MEQNKLQKLCYYAQAWNLVFNGNKMFDGNFEAWVHGPINRNLWNSLKEYSCFCIEQNHFAKKAKPIKDEVIITVLNDVWATYSNLSGYQLELLTQQEEPWIEARYGLSSVAPSTININPETMKQYYSSLINKGEKK